MTLAYDVSKVELLAIACAGAKFDDKDAYVFASALRVPCRAIDHEGPGECGMEYSDEAWGFTRIDSHCGGRLWHPTEDFAVWFLEIHEAQFWASLYHNEKRGTGVTGHVWYKNNPGHYISREKDIMEALLQSLVHALVDVGATLYKSVEPPGYSASSE